MKGRTSGIERRTKETDISVKVNIDGNGRYDIKCGNTFLKHMIETLSRYSSADITMKAEGDDEHHLIEDVGITLGTAFKDAVGKAPIERMATKTVVMDDAMVTISIDIVDRPYADIDCPDPVYHHFFRSFAMSSGITLHILVIRGFDDHHTVEASFKAWGRCLREAVRKRDAELSTKDGVSVKGV
ncbi:MAG: imidazoleglycerol-phosphate dehydratase [Methanomassiliicoccaceae archaeon]|jgi:imidazoleglycerol-phosphate dehydratase|nr:imidazoleglycerol-phosphate dehydratase [Methanomassiliicoccaceae archaeon]